MPPLLVAASGPNAAEAAGRISDGFISTVPQQSLLEHFDAGGGGRQAALRADERLLG